MQTYRAGRGVSAGARVQLQVLVRVCHLRRLRILLPGRNGRQFFPLKLASKENEAVSQKKITFAKDSQPQTGPQEKYEMPGFQTVFARCGLVGAYATTSWLSIPRRSCEDRFHCIRSRLPRAHLKPVSLDVCQPGESDVRILYAHPAQVELAILELRFPSLSAAKLFSIEF